MPVVGWNVWRAGPDTTPEENGQARCAIPRVVVPWGFGAMARVRSALWLKQTFPQLDREHRAMVDLRASFAYKENMEMTDEIKNALAHLDLDKTGRVSTSELVAAAKALEEVRRGSGWGGRACWGVAGTVAWWGGRELGVMQGRRGEGTNRLQERQWRSGERCWQPGERCGECSGFLHKGVFLVALRARGVLDCLAALGCGRWLGFCGLSRALESQRFGRRTRSCTASSSSTR